MPSKRRSVYRCTDCGNEHPKWAGRCDGCGAWNTLTEEIAAPRKPRTTLGSATTSQPVLLSQVSNEPEQRRSCGVGELDVVLGGGLVPGSVVLIGGEPGIGKSTLLLQSATAMGPGGATLYVSGEESVAQLRLRAERLNVGGSELLVLGETRLEAILGAARATSVSTLIVDSIQTIYTEELEGAPGNVGQVRECAAQLMRFAKQTNTVVMIVGHVTKGGGIAGPKTLEHIVDTVVYFEGETNSGLRVIRAVKNRFGSVDEVGIFEMTQSGLAGVENPSAALLAGRQEDTSGSAVTALMEGSRPVLVEVQALAAKTGYGTPQRVAHGLDQKRLAVILAVLERRAGIPFADLDVFLNVAGGMRLLETAADLAVAAALWSSVMDKQVRGSSVFLGEIGLGGEVRPVSATERRLAEAANMGFERCYLSHRASEDSDLELIRVKHISELAASFAA
ncbi:MAG: DNA repair protein RadA [Gemmatimonadales bacterium]